MTLKETIMMELRNAIAWREYKPGEHLKEADLSRRFNVSRTPIREALIQLEKEGFIKMTPEVGAKVVQLSQNDISNIYDILIVLEGLSSRLAYTRLKNEQIDKLEELHLMMVKALGEKKILTFSLNSIPSFMC